MSYVHSRSKRCEKSEIDLFSVPPTQLSLEKGRWIDYRPLSNVTNDDGAITFLIAGTDEYIDLSRTILTVEGKIEKSSPGGDADIAPINNFLHSLFKQVDVYLNGKQATPAMGTYPYRAYLETLLNYDVSAKKSQLSSALYFKHTPGEMDNNGSLPTKKEITYIKGTYTPGAGKPDSGDKETVSFMQPESGNQGFAKRSKFITGGKKFTLSGPIFSDIFMCDRLLLNMLDLKVVLNRSPNTFCLMDVNTPSKSPKVKFEDVVLKIWKVKVDDVVSTANEVALKKTPALYPIRRVECKALSIPAGLPHVRKDNIFSGTIPKSFVFGVVDAKAYSGMYGAITATNGKRISNGNPYNFKNYNVSTITLTVNGEEIPFKQLNLDYKGGDDGKTKGFVQAYNTLFSGTGKMYANTGLDITREDYAKGYTLYAFDLTPDMCNSSGYFNAVQRGSLSVDITFDGAPTAPVVMVCYGDFENVISIDSQRNVI